ncbi:MAG: VCBS repeat-containing protein [Bacteroidia bacterium]|nr:VCBS repeat-containing protein [Bacteroidia bacterium]
MKFRLTSLLGLAIVLVACKTESTSNDIKSNALFSLVSSKQSGIAFKNEVKNTKKFNIFSYRNFYNGGGVGIGDLNNDGLSDIYFTKNMGSNKLYLNKGDLAFEDVTDKAGVASEDKWSTGVVMVDVNGDGWLDIYVCNAGYQKGKDQRNELYINNKDLTFTESAADYGLDQNGYTTHTAFFDYDLDGDLDAYILNNSFMPVNTLNYSNKRELYAEDWPVRDFLKGGGDKLLKNDNGKYVDVTKEAGIYGSLIGFGLGVTVGDVNDDMLPDLYISNDFFERDYLYVNQGDGTFSEEIREWTGHISQFSMGADMADINNDGYPEIFVTDMMPYSDKRLKETTLFESYKLYQEKQRRDFYHQYMHNSLQLNNKDESFSEIAQFSGVEASDWSWGALMFDADNDGYRDIYVCNGVLQDVTNQDFIDFFANDVVQKMVLTGEKEEMDSVIAKMPSTALVNRFFHNQQDLKFEDKSKEWGLEKPSFSNGAAYGDLDNDGDLELVVNNLQDKAFLFRNNSREQENTHFVKVKLSADAPNTQAIGAKVFVYVKGMILNFQQIPSRGFQSSVDQTMLFGLGQNSSVDSIAVLWPDKTRSSISSPVIDTLLILNKSDLAAKPFMEGESRSPKTIFRKSISELEAHEEDNHDDFANEGLLIRELSHEGPAVAYAENQKDGLYVGGGAGQEAYIYSLGRNGLRKKTISQFKEDSEFEDTAAEWVDIDGDKDLDLIVGSGGNNHPIGDRLLQDRVYINNGRGRFTRQEDALPINGFNTSVIVPVDFDNDGDQDLLIGSRSVPGKYGQPPRSFIYQNDGKGKFKDVAKQVGKEFQNLGMITDAKLINILGDDTPELLVVGEWMAPKVFSIKNGRFELVKTTLEEFSGWFYAIESDDIDGDGDLDLILGNRGENFYFSGNKEAPAKLWVKDFDFNGSLDPIITKNIDGRDMPLSMKKELTEQIVSLKKQNLKHSDYATKSIQDLFGDKGISQAIVMEGNYFKSAVAINKGDGNFEMKALPTEVQLSCVCDIYCKDLNNDGKNDLVLAGNFSQFVPQYSKLDGSQGHVLINQGGGNYEALNSRESGFSVKEDVKQLLPLKVGNKDILLAFINNGKPYRFELQGN